MYYGNFGCFSKQTPAFQPPTILKMILAPNIVLYWEDGGSAPVVIQGLS